MTYDTWLITLIALATALATGLGALPFLFVSTVGSRWVGRGDALAAGLMLGATAGLVYTGAGVDAWLTTWGIGIGLVAVALGARASELHGGELEGAELARRTGIVLVSVMTLHSCAEGIGVGVAFAGEGQVGITTAIAIGVHNIPEGLAISLVLIPAGASVARAAWMSVLSSLPQPLLAVPSFLLVSHVEPLLPWGFGIAAGAMLWMAWRLVIDASAELTRVRVAGVTAMGLGAMVVFQWALA